MCITVINSVHTTIKNFFTLSISDYDYIVINDDLDAAFADVQAIVTAERLRRDRRPGLFDFVQGLLDEKLD